MASVVGHVAPRSRPWRAHRLYETGDVITIDIENRRIDVKADLKARMAKGFTPPEPKYRHGAYAKYAKLVHSASDGAVTSFPFD